MPLNIKNSKIPKLHEIYTGKERKLENFAGKENNQGNLGVPQWNGTINAWLSN